jgi:hypothetical protein
MISGCRCDVNDECALLGFYPAQNVNSVPAFLNNLSVPYSRVTECSETSVKNYHFTLRKIPEERRCQVILSL